MDEGGWKAQTFSYEIRNSQEFKVQHGDHSSQYCSVYFQVVKRVILRVLITHTKILTMCGDECQLNLL